MKAVLLALVVLGAGLAVLPEAGATHMRCRVSDVECMAECLFWAILGDPCGVYRPQVGFTPCPPGHVGRVVVVDGTPVPVCVPPALPSFLP